MSDGTLALASPSAALGIGLTLSPLLRARHIVADYVASDEARDHDAPAHDDALRHADRRSGHPALLACGGDNARRSCLAAGGANALNCFIDRDIDAQMARTRNRAIAAGPGQPGRCAGIWLDADRRFGTRARG